MSYCAYIWRDPKTGSAIYVGEGVMTRPFQHLRKSSNSRLQHILSKRRREGYELSPVVIAAMSKEDAEEIQDLLIAMYGCEFDGTGVLFNLVKEAWGAKGYRHTPEERARRSFKRPPEWCAAISAARLAGGYKPTLEHRKKNSEGRKGIPSSQHQKAVVSAMFRELKWFNNGEVNKRLRECPPGWVAGRVDSNSGRRGNRCTVDGETIYESRIELVRALGQGIKGSRCPTFRYLKEEQ